MLVLVLYVQALPEGLPATYAEEQVMEQVRGHFTPELLNRIDEVVLFERLKPESMRAIVDVHVAKAEALAAERGISLGVTGGARNWLARETYDPQFGARPLIRALGSEILNPLARKILDGSVSAGDDVEVDVDDSREEDASGDNDEKQSGSLSISVVGHHKEPEQRGAEGISE